MERGLINFNQSHLVLASGTKTSIFTMLPLQFDSRYHHSLSFQYVALIKKIAMPGFFFWVFAWIFVTLWWHEKEKHELLLNNSQLLSPTSWSHLHGSQHDSISQKPTTYVANAAKSVLLRRFTSLYLNLLHPKKVGLCGIRSCDLQITAWLKWFTSICSLIWRHKKSHSYFSLSPKNPPNFRPELS